MERAPFGLPTAFVARAGRKRGPVVAFLCEYDALPDLGHACGHNIIAAASLGAGLASAVLADACGGVVLVVGTPAEEGGGGKVLLAAEGAFEGVDVAMMVHPSDHDLTYSDTLACSALEVEYYGRSAHAAAFPEHGKNALDGAVLGYGAIAALRQHIDHSDRVHGIFSKAGTRPNIVPDHTVAEWYVRSRTPAALAALKDRVLACLRSGAAAAGCVMRWRETAPDYWDLRTNRPLLELYRSNSQALGRRVDVPANGARNVLSTDMGNVSYRVASVHPMVKVASSGVAIHSKEFSARTASADGDHAVLDAAKRCAAILFRRSGIDEWMLIAAPLQRGCITGAASRVICRSARHRGGAVTAVDAPPGSASSR